MWLHGRRVKVKARHKKRFPRKRDPDKSRKLYRYFRRHPELVDPDLSEDVRKLGAD
jgi:hypothetical protein